MCEYRYTYFHKHDGEIDVDMRGSYIRHTLLNEEDIAKKATAWLREKVCFTSN